MCKITLFIGSLSGGGAERVTCNLANYLNANGYEVDVITMSNACDTYKLESGINRICLLDEKERVGRITNLRIRMRRLKQYVINNQDVDCYVVMLPITIFMLMRLKRFTRGKIIISERNNPGSYKLYEKMMMKYAAKKSDGLVVQTEEIGKWYKDVKNKVVIPNAINKDIVFPGRNKVENRIVSVSRLEKQKNLTMLINAFEVFSKKFPEYKLEIYGKGDQEQKLKDLVLKKHLGDKIEFMGYVDNVLERIADADCFVLTSDYEGMPNALIEAMCMGIPCIATDCDGGGAKELIKNKKNGVLIKKGDVGSLVLALEKIMLNKKFSEKISSDARLLNNRLSYDEIYSKWVRFIKNTVGNEVAV